MHAFTSERIRASFINTTVRERAAIAFPAEFDRLDWARLDFLGWRPSKQPLVGYLTADLDGEPVSLLLRQTEVTPKSRDQCSWCADVTLPNPVVMFSAKKAGAAGRRGDTVGALVCAGFECSRNVRRLPPLAFPGFDREAARLQRIERLRAAVAGFVRAVSDESPG